jgi:hypothetical protein
MLFGVIGTIINFCCVAPLTYIVNNTYGFTITNKLDIFDKNGKIIKGLNEHGEEKSHDDKKHRLLEEVKALDSIINSSQDSSKSDITITDTTQNLNNTENSSQSEIVISHSNEASSHASSHVDTYKSEMFTESKIYFSSKEILLFASVISATDAVAALAFIKEDSDPKLFPILFGEGVVNDAVCIVLYQIIKGFLNSGRSK